MIAIQTSFQLYNEMHPIDLNTEEELLNNNNRNEENTYMDYFKRALKLALSQVYCNPSSYLHDDEGNLSQTPLTSFEKASEVTEDQQPQEATTASMETQGPKTQAQIIVERPIILSTPESKIIRTKIRQQQQSCKPLSNEQKAIFNSYLQRQKLQLGGYGGEEIDATHAFAP